MTKRIFKYIILISLTFSCSDDFVDVETDDITSDSFFTNPEDYDLALIGVYDLLQSTFFNVMVGEIASDNTLAGGESPIDVLGIQEIDNMTHFPENQQLRDIWQHSYSGINRANFLIQNEEKLEFDGRDQIMAQAKFLRAYFYFELVKWFGDVPMSETVIEFGQQYAIDRSPKALVYELIVSDLIYARDHLEHQLTGASYGRVTKGAAQALLGKAYVYSEQWDKAAVELQDLIANGPYSLLQGDDYLDMFEEVQENSVESVFEIQYTDQEGGSFGCFTCVEGNIAVGFSGPRQYQGEKYDSGYSFNVPTQEAYDAFKEGDARREVTVFNANLLPEGSYFPGHENTGFFNAKYIPRKGDLNIPDPNLTNPNNYRSIRYADVLLLAAEALVKSNGSETDAISYLNQIRSRAFIGAIDTNHLYKPSEGDLLEAIYKERRLELMGEGHRFFDLVRTNQAEGVIPGFSKAKGHELFPIPLIEIQLAGSRWEQNPGY